MKSTGNKKKPASKATERKTSAVGASHKKKPQADKSDLESGDNVAQRETDSMDVTTREGKRSIKDEGF